MLALGVGNAWGAEATLSSISTKNVVTTKGQSVSTTFGDVTCKVTRNSGNQPGFYTSSGIVRYYSGDVMTLSVPSGNTITKVVFTMNSGNVGTVDVGTVSSNTWTGNAESISFTGTATVKITKIVVTYEATSGGQTPEPDPDPTPDPEPDPEEPGTGGEALSYTWDLSKKTYSAASNTQVTWSATDVNMVADKGTAGTAPNNYLGGDANNRTSSRFYQNSILTITPEANVTIISVVFTATSTNYATALKGSTWTNATASANNTTVTVTPTDGTTAISAKIGGTCGFTGVTVNYTKTSSGSGETVVSLKLDQTSLKLNKGTTATLTATVENSEDPITWSSDKPSVATIANGVVTAVGKGTATITASVGEVKATCSVEVIEITGAGTEENPYTATDIITLGLNDKTKAWVEGYIIGVMENNNLVANTTSTNSNIVLADAADATENYVPVALPSGSNVRTALNLKDNSSNLGKKVAVYGTLETYFTLPGVKSVSEYKWIVEEGELAAPTITPAGGTYYAAQNVTILAEEGSTIYYTLDGSNPTTGSNLYSTPISIAETATLKAIAVKGEKTSPVASENYTINLPLTTMDAIFAKATAVGNTATSVQVVMNNWVITGVKGSNAYLTDGTKGLIIYNTSHGFEVGDVLSGTVECKVQLYNGSSELKELTSATTGLTKTKGGTVDPVVLDATGIAALSGVNTGSVIKINGVATSKDVVAGVKLYNTLFSFTDLTVGQEYNVTGVYLQYNETKEILPRSEADIEMVEGLPSVIIEVENITMEVGEEKTISVSTNPADAQVTYTITSGTCVTLDGSTIKAVSEGTATITASVAEKAGEYKGATKDFTVTVKTPEQALTDWVLTSLSDITINDLVVITMTKGETTWAMTNDNGSSAAPVASPVTLSADALASEPAKNLKWVVSNDNGTLTIYPYGDYETWLYSTTSNNGIRVGTSENKTFKIDDTYGYLYNIATSRYVGVYNNEDWRSYTSMHANISDQTLKFFVKKNANDILPGTGEDPEEPGDDPVVPTPTINPTATFIFNTAEGLTNLGITYPTTADEDTEGAYKTDFVDGASYTQDDITMTTTGGTTVATRVWLTATGKIDLRVYKGATLTFSVPAEHQISKIVFDGSNIGHLLVNGNAVSGKAWTGSAQTITFTAKSDASTIKINTIAFVVEYTRNVTNKYGSICLPYASASTSGAYFYEVVGKGTENGKPAVYLASVNTLKAGVPYIFEKTANTIKVVYSSEKVDTPQDANGLIGNFTNEYVVPANNYILYNNAFIPADGTTNKVNAYRAYLDLNEVRGGKPTQMPGRRYIGMDVQGENVETGVEDLFTTDAPVKVIENGQLIIIRDGVKYNVQGQVIK